MNKEYDEIDLKELFIQYLRHGWAFIICMVLCGALLGGICILKSSGTVPAALGSVSEEDLTEYEEYENDLYEYNATLESYDSRIALAEASIELLKEQKEGSVVLNLNPYDYCQSEQTWHISAGSGFQGQADTAMVAATYARLLESTECYRHVQEWLTEPYGLYAVKECITYSTDSKNGNITISAVGPDSAFTGEILEAVNIFIDNYYADVCAAVADHKIKVLGNTSSYTTNAVDENSGNMTVSSEYPEVIYINNAGSGYTPLNSNTVLDCQKSYNSSLDAYYKTISDVMALRAKLTVPEEPEETEGSAVPAASGPSKKELLKYTFIGALIGLLVVFIIITVNYLAKDPFTDEEEVSRRLNVSVLAGLRRFKVIGVFSLLCSVLSGDKERCRNVSELAELSAANIKALLKASGCEEGPILVAGTDKKSLEILKKEKPFNDGSLNLVFAGDILSDAGSVDLISPCSMAVLVEKKDSASLRKIHDEAVKLDSLGKTLLGLIAF